MILFSLAFLLGDLYLQTFADFPANYFFYLVAGGSILFWQVLHKRWRYAYLPCAFAMGFIWTAWQVHATLSFTLPHQLEGKTLQVKGYIASIPIVDRWQTSFIFKLKRCNKKIIKQNIYLKLGWRNPTKKLRIGDEWKFLVRLKRVHGTENQGGFDFESWSLQKGIRATGIVITKEKQRFLMHHSYYRCIDQFRQRLQEKIEHLLPSSPLSPWLLALTIGERHGIPDDQWRVLRNTGTNHLMAIAGLHIGVISGFAFCVTSWLWRFFPNLVLRLPVMHAGFYASFFAAILYSALAGFSLPTQRACIMLCVFIANQLMRLKINPWSAWSCAFMLVLIFNPLSVLTESFWLSFGTIALIIYGMQGRISASGIWWKWGRVQCVIGFGLIPLTLFFFQSCSLISFFANSIAIPWLSFFILPFCFLSIIFLFFSSSFAAFLLQIACKSLTGLWVVLTWFANIPFFSWQQIIPNWVILLITSIGFLLLLLPAGFPGRLFSLIWFLPFLFFKPDKPNVGDIWLTLLDVGQGLSVVVQTHSHTLVYDAGPKFNTNFDMGERVVLPYLNTIGIKKIDTLVVSHGDNDHIGGVNALINAKPITHIITSVPYKFANANVSYCLAGTHWHWDHVHFSFIYPTKLNLNLGNNSSCVLRIDNGLHSILLTGDIEKAAEKYILNTNEKLAANILIAPHHGSKTSGLKQFVYAVHPQYVLYAIGYHNRYHFPHPSVVKTYARMNTKQLDTAKNGAIQFKLKKNKIYFSPDLYRISNRHYWYDS